MDLAADWGTLGLLAYAVIALVVMLDSVLPVVPSEALLLAAAGGSTSGSPTVVGVVAAAAAGALAGDVVVFTLGRRAGHRWGHRLRRHAGWRKAAGLFGSTGPGVVVVGRYVPLGRTVVAFGSGTSGLAWRRYLPAAACGAVAWAVVMTVIGRTASSVSGNLVVTVGVGLAACALLGGIAGTLVRRRGRRRGSVAAIAPTHRRRTGTESGGAEELAMAA